MDKYPDIVISLNITERYVDLIEERVDLMFFTGQLKDNNLVTQQIGEAKAVVRTHARVMYSGARAGDDARIAGRFCC